MIQVDSDDELEAEALLEMKHAKIIHHGKSALKSRPIMPRTNARRTMSGMARALSAAGMDPSRIEERAAILAKAARAKEVVGKRKRDEEMELDSDGEFGGDSDGMDLDGEDESPKRAKTNAGVVAKRAPKTDRQLAGMRDAAQAAKATKLRNLGQRERNMLAKAGESDRAIKVKKVSLDWMERRVGIDMDDVSQNTCSRESARVARRTGDEGAVYFSLWIYRLCTSVVYEVTVPEPNNKNRWVARRNDWYRQSENRNPKARDPYMS